MHSETLFQALRQQGFDFFTGTPCSYLKPLINYASTQLRFVMAVNEGDAVALAAGAYLAGAKPVVLFQNSGLGNAVNPLTSLSQLFHLPFLGLVSLRGNPQADPDAPQHTLMGQITPALLDVLQIPWAYFPTEHMLNTALQEVAQAFQQGRPFFWLVREGDVADYALGQSETGGAQRAEALLQRSTYPPELPRRTAALDCIQQLLPAHAVLFATTGKTGRELYALDDRANQFYMLGSMGCALSLGLGVSLIQPQRPVWVIDGDGALLMRTGPMHTVGCLQPACLVHLLLDNGVHDSTGGQASYSENTDFCLLAQAMAYAQIRQIHTLNELSAALTESLTLTGPHFFHLRIAVGSPKVLARPVLTPPELAQRFRRFLQA